MAIIGKLLQTLAYPHFNDAFICKGWAHPRIMWNFITGNFTVLKYCAPSVTELFNRRKANLRIVWQHENWSKWNFKYFEKFSKVKLISARNVWRNLQKIYSLSRIHEESLTWHKQMLNALSIFHNLANLLTRKTFLLKKVSSLKTFKRSAVNQQTFHQKTLKTFSFNFLLIRT